MKFFWGNRTCLASDKFSCLLKISLFTLSMAHPQFYNDVEISYRPVVEFYLHLLLCSILPFALYVFNCFNCYFLKIIYFILLICLLIFN